MENYTPNYRLHQWEPQDPFLRTDFNEDLQKIDAALGNAPIFISGQYVGTGTSGERHPNILNFDIQPQMVILNTQEMCTYNDIAKYYILFPNMTNFPVPNSGEQNVLTWTKTGISWYYSTYSSYTDEEKAFRQYNTKGKTYHYVAAIW